MRLSWSLVVLITILTGCESGDPAALGAPCAADDDCATGFCATTCRSPGADDDGDGVDNRTERQRGSDPGQSDTDRDGLLDGDEGERDTDRDGRLDVVESALVDADKDCMPAQLDVDEATPETDLAKVAAARCRRAGVCADGTVTARCDTLTIEGVQVAEITCDYSDIFAFDGQVEVRCDGRDNDCDGTTDEDLGAIDSSGAVRGLGQSCVGTGACAVRDGVIECSADARAVCSVDAGGSAGPDGDVDLDCDAIDNDCDGVTDEGVAWTDPATGERIGFGEPCADLGACSLGPGIVECAATTKSGVCSTGRGGSLALTTAEGCNAIDDDCDGVTDEGLTWLAPDGQPRVIGEACGVGACRGGTVVCGGGQATCSSLGLAGPETCNAEDDDCDGAVDEVGELMDDCPSLGVCGDLEVVGVSCVASILICSFASPEVIEPIETRCNGVDDDCDGATDEGLVPRGGGSVGDACQGIGACAEAPGTIVCAADGIGTQCNANVTDALELCNGVDDDCDGVTDESPTDDADCSELGVCAAYVEAGARCVGGAWRCAYVDDLAFELGETRCDRLDNDCDGATDEGLARVPDGTFVAEHGHSPPDRFTWPSADTPTGPLLFGGAAYPSSTPADGAAPILLGDLWRYDATRVSWQRLSATGGPSARAGHAVAWDPKHQVFVVHGGFTSVTRVGELGPDGAPVATLFVYDPAAATWATVREVGTAPARRYHALAALGDGRLAVHGGLPVGVDATTAALGGEPALVLGELTRDGGGWSCTWSVPAVDNGASWRYAHALVADGGELVVVGGRALGGGLEPVVDTVWRGVPGEAFEVVPELTVSGDFPAALPTPHGLVVMGDSLALLDLEVLVARPFSSALAAAPPVMRGGVLAHDLDEPERALLIEGSTADGEAGRRTFTLALEPPELDGVDAWSAPAPRIRAALVVDPSGVFHLVGGARRAGRGPLQDVWRWDAASAQWLVELAPTPPHSLDPERPALWGAAATWSSSRDGILLWGGDGLEAAEPVLWLYAAGVFTRYASAFAPPPGPAVFVDADHLVVCAAETLELWTLALGAEATWTRRATTPVTGELVAAGWSGSEVAAIVHGDFGLHVYRADLEGWSAPSALIGEAPPRGAQSVWDAAHERAYVLAPASLHTLDVAAGTMTGVALVGSGAPLGPALGWDPTSSTLIGMGGVHTSTTSPAAGPATARTFFFGLACE